MQRFSCFTSQAYNMSARNFILLTAILFCSVACKKIATQGGIQYHYREMGTFCNILLTQEMVAGPGIQQIY